jgi:hypothetical protein
MTSPWYLLEGEQDCWILLCLMEAFEPNSAKQAFTSSKAMDHKTRELKGDQRHQTTSDGVPAWQERKMNAVCEGTSQLFSVRHFVGSRQ